MDNELYPVVNGCYLDMNSEMFKVRMLGYLGKDVNSIIIEDTSGNVKSLNLNSWKNMHLIPCCVSSPTLQKQSNCPA